MKQRSKYSNKRKKMKLIATLINNRNKYFNILNKNNIVKRDETNNNDDDISNEKELNRFEQECNICYEENLDKYCLVPCGCTGFCKQCVKEIKKYHNKCPYCENEIKGKILLVNT